MALTVGVNSWATIAEADAYLQYKIGAANWFTLPDTAANAGDSKENYLISAFYFLTNYPGITIDAGNTTEVVKTAQIETALFLLKYGEEYNCREAMQAGGVESFKYSKTEEDFNSKGPTLPNSIIGPLLPDYSTIGGGFGCLTGEDYGIE